MKIVKRPLETTSGEKIAVKTSCKNLVTAHLKSGNKFGVWSARLFMCRDTCQTLTMNWIMEKNKVAHCAWCLRWKDVLIDQNVCKYSHEAKLDYKKVILKG